MRLGNGSYCLGIDKSGTDTFETVVGNFTSIAGGTYIHGPDNHACVYNRDLVTTFDFGAWGVAFTRSGWSKGPVTIGNDVWIGEDVKILSGVHIGDGAIVGAHSVIAKDIPPYAVVVGNPAVVKRYRFKPAIIKKLLKIKWWDWENDVIRSRLGEMQNAEEFVKKYG